MSELQLYKKSDNTTFDRKSLNKHEKDGRNLCKNNETYRNIEKVMENQYFKSLFNKYFKSVHELQTIIMFFTLYKQIENKTCNSINGYQKISILDKIMKDSRSRQYICSKVVGNTKLLI